MNRLSSFDRTLLPGSLLWFALGAVCFVVLIGTLILRGELPSDQLPIFFFALIGTARGLQLRRRHTESRGVELLDLDRVR